MRVETGNVADYNYVTILLHKWYIHVILAICIAVVVEGNIIECLLSEMSFQV